MVRLLTALFMSFFFFFVVEVLNSSENESFQKVFVVSVFVYVAILFPLSSKFKNDGLPSQMWEFAAERARAETSGR